MNIDSKISIKNHLSKLLIVSLFLLTGCASTFTSRVTTNNNLPATLNDKSYQIASNKDYGDTPEFTHAADEVRARLQAQGFSETKDDKARALHINIELASSNGDAEINSPYGPVRMFSTPFGTLIPFGPYPYFGFAPFHRFPSTRFYRRSMMSPWSPFSPYYFGYYDPFRTTYFVRQFYEHELTITISDAASNAVLYKVTAKTEKTDPEIAAQIEYLVECALKDFPNKSGSTWVQLKLEKN